jgi:hypothetical protein
MSSRAAKGVYWIGLTPTPKQAEGKEEDWTDTKKDKVTHLR